MNLRVFVLLAFAAAFVFPGCAQVMNDHVIGPHGDVLEELQCARVEDCYELARKECKGNFDVVQSMTYGNSGGQGMMIKCG